MRPSCRLCSVRINVVEQTSGLGAGTRSVIENQAGRRAESHNSAPRIFHFRLGGAGAASEGDHPPLASVDFADVRRAGQIDLHFDRRAALSRGQRGLHRARQRAVQHCHRPAAMHGAHRVDETVGRTGFPDDVPFVGIDQPLVRISADRRRGQVACDNLPEQLQAGEILKRLCGDRSEAARVDTLNGSSP